MFPSVPEEKTVSSQNKSTLFVFVLVLCLAIGYVITFGSGFYLAALLNSEKRPSPSPTPQVHSTPTPKENEPGIVNEQFYPGKNYFDDTVYLISKKEPHHVLIATVTRNEQDKGYIQGVRVSYFDGQQWTRKTDSTSIPDSGMKNNSILQTWEISVDPSRVLKETINGSINIDKTLVSFSLGQLENEIGLRSLPGYTKFMSVGYGSMLTIDGQTEEAYGLSSRIYSLNAKDIQFYDQPLGLTTDWIAFWDTEGNFYHIDTTHVEKPTDIYKTHTIAVKELSDRTIQKTFAIQIERGKETPPNNYSISFPQPIGSSLQLQGITSLNKAPGSTYAWFLSEIEGTVTNAKGNVVSGIGLAEYIHD